MMFRVEKKTNLTRQRMIYNNSFRDIIQAAHITHLDQANKSSSYDVAAYIPRYIAVGSSSSGSVKHVSKVPTANICSEHNIHRKQDSDTPKTRV